MGWTYRGGTEGQHMVPGTPPDFLPALDRQVSGGLRFRHPETGTPVPTDFVSVLPPDSFRQHVDGPVGTRHLFSDPTPVHSGRVQPPDRPGPVQTSVDESSPRSPTGNDGRLENRDVRGRWGWGRRTAGTRVCGFRAENPSRTGVFLFFRIQRS